MGVDELNPENTDVVQGKSVKKHKKLFFIDFHPYTYILGVSLIGIGTGIEFNVGAGIAIFGVFITMIAFIPDVWSRSG